MQGESGGLIRHTEPVQAAWIDYNGHMNVAFYVMAFDRATDAVLDSLDLGAAYAAASGQSIFVVDMHVSYRQEVHAGALLRFESRLLGYDKKRLHLFHTMFDGDATKPAALNEIMCLHVDLETRRAAEMPADRLPRLERLWKAQKSLGPPDGAGQVINSLR